MKRLALLALAAALAFAQQPAPVGPAPLAPGETIRVVDVKKGQAQTIQDNLGRIFPGISRVGQQLIVRGQPPVVDMIEDAIKKLDVSAPENQAVPNVELTVQLLLASTKEGTDAKTPIDLESTLRQLRSLFPYKSYRVLDTTILRGRSGQFLEASSSLSFGTATNGMLQVKVQPTVSPGPAPRSVRMARLELGLRIPIEVVPNSYQYQPSGINTEMDAKEGQKTVVGKANLVGSEDAIFMVITPKVIE